MIIIILILKRYHFLNLHNKLILVPFLLKILTLITNLCILTDAERPNIPISEIFEPIDQYRYQDNLIIPAYPIISLTLQYLGRVEMYGRE